MIKKLVKKGLQIKKNVILYKCTKKQVCVTHYHRKGEFNMKIVEKIYDNGYDGYVCKVEFNGKVFKGFYTYKEVEDMENEVDEVDDMSTDFEMIDDIDMIIDECENLRDSQDEDEDVRDKINDMICDLYRNRTYDHKEILNILSHKLDKNLSDDFMYSMIDYIMNAEEYVEY